jgi:CRP-like cAMP-binding protein
LKWAFNRNEHLQSITNAQKERLINLVELKEYGNQEIVCKEGDKIEGLMFVL